MEKVIFKDKYPVWKIELDKEKVNKSLDEVVEYFIEQIKSDPIAKFIEVFDHLEHTKSFGGEIAKDIMGAKIVVFCFGKEIPGPLALAVRPRSIGIVETPNKYVISFLEAPSELANKKMQDWVNKLAN